MNEVEFVGEVREEVSIQRFRENVNILISGRSMIDRQRFFEYLLTKKKYRLSSMCLVRGWRTRLADKETALKLSTQIIGSLD